MAVVGLTSLSKERNRRNRTGTLWTRIEGWVLRCPQEPGAILPRAGSAPWE